MALARGGFWYDATVRFVFVVGLFAGVLSASPVEYSKESVKAGRRTYLRLCQYCHGTDGKALANPDFEAPDLTAPTQWRFGDTDEALFKSIHDGAGHDMPPFKDQLEDDEIRRLVHFLRSIGPAKHRPQ